MQFDELFRVGVRWKHRERELVVFIQKVIEPGKFVLSFWDKQEKDFEPEWARTYILGGVWTTEDLILHFDPMPVRMTRYDHIAEDDILDDEFTPP